MHTSLEVESCSQQTDDLLVDLLIAFNMTASLVSKMFCIFPVVFAICRFS